MNRRHFLRSTAAVVGGSVIFASQTDDPGLFAQSAATPTSPKENLPMNIVIAADPFAIALKDAIVAHLKEKGHAVIDVGATTDKDIPYYDGVIPACRMLQEKKADRAILFCGTGMGMSVIANRFSGVVASCVESVFATKMCRAVNDANALCLGSMIWGEWMAKEAVDAFLSTEFTEGLPQFTDFLKDALKKVEKIRP